MPKLTIHHLIAILLLAIVGIESYATFAQKADPRVAPVGVPSRHLLAEQAGDIALVALTAEQRIAYVNKSSGVICSEPSPDATLDSAQSEVGALNIAAGKAAIAAAVSASGALSSQSSGNAIFRRSQSVQFLRDSMFHLCQGMLNGAIKKEAYAAYFNDLVNKSSLALQVEIAAAKGEKASTEVAVPKAKK